MKLNKGQFSKLRQLQTKYRLELVILHGSKVEQRTHTQSDLDIAVTRKNPLGLFPSVNLINDLRIIFPKEKVDLADITHADPLFLFAVLSRSQLLSGKPKDYKDLQLKAFHDYQDYLPYLEQESDFIRKKLKTYVTA